MADELDEVQDFVAEVERLDRSTDRFSIFINPTLDCNLRCWYCYEKHRKDTRMTASVREDIGRLVARKVEQEALKVLQLSFFGGEPLLEFDEVVWPILQNANSLCIERGKGLEVIFTSNSYALAPDMVERLRTLQLAAPVSWQITLDGSRPIHNRIRHTAERGGTYDTIVANIHLLLRSGMDVLVRLNYQMRHILSFLDVIDDFKELPADQRKRLSFSFQRVWQDVAGGVSADFPQSDLEEVKKAFEQAGFELLQKDNRPQRCYADKTNSILINYNGDLYNCTAQDFVKESCEGVLQTDGVLKLNEKYNRRMKSRFNNTVCRACKIFPLCFGGCSQKQKYRTKDCCVLDYTLDDKIQIIRKRIQSIAESY